MKNKDMIKCIRIIAVAIIALLLAVGIIFFSVRDKNGGIKQIPVTVSQNRENELVFDFSIDDCIECFNGCYYSRRHENYIKPLTAENWHTETLEKAIHSPHETIIYDYSADRTVWSLPTISVYVPANRDCVQEITLNFDWHSYSEKLLDLYNEMCFCTLKMFFYDLSDEKITEVYSEANRLGEENTFSSEYRYSDESVPSALFYKDGIGVYSYSAEGSYQRLCIIPVTEETLKVFEEKGTEIFEIE